MFLLRGWVQGLSVIGLSTDGFCKGSVTTPLKTTTQLISSSSAKHQARASSIKHVHSARLYFTPTHLIFHSPSEIETGTQIGAFTDLPCGLDYPCNIYAHPRTCVSRCACAVAAKMSRFDLGGRLIPEFSLEKKTAAKRGCASARCS